MIFLDKGFNVQLSLCNWCHDTLMMAMNLKNAAILNIHGVDYYCIINKIRKSEVMNLSKNADSNYGTF